MTTAITTVEPERPLSATDIRAQVNLIQEVMKAVMIEGQHFGVIPGCGNKPTLLKPGAEKLMATFRLAIDPEVHDLSDECVRRYRVIARVTAQSNGRFLGAGVGECSSAEEKYQWREAVCKEEWDETDPVDRRNKWKKGRGHEDPYCLHQIKTNEADLANTILKMAKKRALVDAILTVTAASDCFTQDIEDMPEEVMEQKPAKATAKSATKPLADAPKADVSTGAASAISDDDYQTLCADWEKEHPKILAQAKATMRVSKHRALEGSQRMAFYHTISDYIKEGQ